MPFFCKKKRTKSTERFRPVPHLPAGDAPPPRKELPSVRRRRKDFPAFLEGGAGGLDGMPVSSAPQGKTAPARAAFWEKRTLLQKNA